MKKQWYLYILIAWIGILSVLYSTLSILRHNHFESGGFDLGLYDQTVWQYSKFLYPFNTMKDRFILGDHLTLTLPLLAPLYWIWSDPRILLIFQAFWVSLSSIAVYKLTRLRKFSETTALSVAIMYSLFYGIQFLVFFDFHPVVIGVGLIAWIAYFLESKRKKLLIASIIFLLLTQENMGIALAGLGCIYFFRQKFQKTSITFIFLGIASSLLAAKLVSLFSPVGFEYTPQISSNPLTILTNFFDEPEKRQTWFYSLSWFSFLPLLSPGAMLAVILDLSQYFITGSAFSRMWSPFMHHRAILGVFLTLGTLETLTHLGTWSKANNLLKITRVKIYKKLASVIPFVLLLGALGQQYLFHFPLNKLSKSEYWKGEQWMRDDDTLIAQVPKDASVATQQNLVPHLSQRKGIYLVYPREHDFLFPVSSVIPAFTLSLSEGEAGIQSGNDKQSIRPGNIFSPCGQRNCWWLDFAGEPQYLVVDLRPGQMLTQILESNENYDAAVANMEKAGKISLEKRIGFASMYKINY